MFFYIKHALVAVALISQCCASSSTSALKSMMDLYKQRMILFTEDHEEAKKINLNFSYTNKNAVEIDKDKHYKDVAVRTAGITKILKDPDRVSKTNYATNDQKKAIFQAIIAGTHIHELSYESGTSDDGPFYIPNHKLEPDVGAGGNRKRIILADANLQKHFDVIEQLQKILIANSRGKHIANKDYKDLETLSGVDHGTLVNWYNEVLKKHRQGPNFTPPIPQLQQDLLSSIDRIDKTTLDIPNTNEPEVYSMAFGNIPDNTLLDSRNKNNAIVFIAAYGLFSNTTTSCAVRIRLDDKNGRQRYIVIQPDDYLPNTPGSPHIVLSHAIINGNAPNRNVDVRIHIVNGDNDTINVTMDETGSVYTHPAADGRASYSPNNMHIRGLPSRALNADEIYSFITRVDGDGKKVDTLHIVTGRNALTPFREIAQGKGWQGVPSENVHSYLERLALQTEFDPFLFKHVKKMIDFAGGNIPTDAS
jgi:hypothetical protein